MIAARSCHISWKASGTSTAYGRAQEMHCYSRYRRRHSFGENSSENLENWVWHREVCMTQQEPTDQIRVFLVEDHPGGLDALAELLQRTFARDIVYAGSHARNSPDLPGCVRQAQAGVVFVDLVLLPEASAFAGREQSETWWVAAIRALRCHGHHSLKIIAYSHWDYLQNLALKAGVDAFLTKNATGDEIRQMIRHVVNKG
jgi:CheY-like chemotaxis protein